MTEKTVKEYQAIAKEAKRDVVRAKLRETIRDMKAGREQRSGNSLHRDNEIAILYNMLNDAGLKKGEDYIDASGPKKIEIYVRIGDEILHFNEKKPYTEIENIDQLENEVEEIRITTKNPQELLRIKSIAPEKLGIIIDPAKEAEKMEVTEQKIKWYRDIDSLNRIYNNSGMDLHDFITDDKADLYIVKSTLGICPNWNGIYCKLFGKDGLEYSELIDDLPIGMKPEDIAIPKCRIPKGMKEIFEVDDQGNPTGKFNWDYITSLIEKTSQIKRTKNHIINYLPLKVKEQNLSLLEQKNKELSSLEAEAKTISETETLLDQQRKGQNIGE